MGLKRLKSTADLYGPVVIDGSDPLSRGADGHSNNTGELQAISEALLWLRDKDRRMSPVLFCLESMYAQRRLPMPLRGSAKCTRAQYKSQRTGSCLSSSSDVGLPVVGSQSLMFQVTAKSQGRRKRANLRHVERPDLRCHCRSFRKLWPGSARPTSKEPSSSER